MLYSAALDVQQDIARIPPCSGYSEYLRNWVPTEGTSLDISSYCSNASMVVDR